MGLMERTAWDCADCSNDGMTIENEFTGGKMTAIVTVSECDEECVFTMDVETAIEVRDHLNDMLEGL